MVSLLSSTYVYSWNGGAKIKSLAVVNKKKEYDWFSQVSILGLTA
jgi:hypothetical protein